MTSLRPAILAAVAAAGAALSLASPAAAAGTMLQTTTTVANLRIEGDAGFIGFAQPFAAPHTCSSGTRVWVDMKTPVGRAAYATAMMALAGQRTITVRAHEDWARVFGECQLYDIVLH